MSPKDTTPAAPSKPPAAITTAMVAGLVHAGFSIYWGLGGTWLLATVGQQMIAAFDGARWLLILVGVVKAVCAVVPYLLARRARISRGPWHWIGWAGAVALIVWGGAGCVTANLVLAGLVTPDGGFDRMGQIGHAWLWDPLFGLWGIALAAGLIILRHRSAAPTESDRRIRA